MAAHAAGGGMVIDTQYPHLHPSARAVIDEGAESRLGRIRTDRWITYARAEAALASFDDLLTFPKRTRMPNLLVVGATKNGKTMIVEKFRRCHPPTPASTTEDGVASVPVLKIKMPPGPMIDLDGIGRLSWPVMMALADALLGTYWTTRQIGGRRALFQKFLSPWPPEKDYVSLSPSICFQRCGPKPVRHLLFAEMPDTRRLSFLQSH